MSVNSSGAWLSQAVVSAGVISAVAVSGRMRMKVWYRRMRRKQLKTGEFS
jgi:hypothetical protein